MSRAEQLGRFLRSLLPAGRGQLLLLLGAYFLAVSWGTLWGTDLLYGRYWHDWGHPAERGLTTSFTHWMLLSRILTLPVLVAAGAGYYLVFLGQARSAKKVVLWVVLPAFAAMAAVIYAAVQLFNVSDVHAALTGPTNTPGGVESNSSHAGRILPLLPFLPMGLGPGLHIAVDGLVLAGIAAWRMRRVSPDGSAIASPDEKRGVAQFAWAVMTLTLPLTLVLIAALVPIESWIVWTIGKGRVPDFWIHETVNGSYRILAAAPMTLIAAWLWGSGAAKRVKALLVPRHPWILAWAVLIPVLLHWTLKLAFFLAARVHGAVYDSGPLISPPAPQLWQYLMPGRRQWDLWRFLVATTFSEIGWRGYGLRKFVERFGLHRGILLLGLFWGAMNLDVGWIAADFGARLAVGVVSSLAWGVVLSYPLAWMTLRSDSVLPAAATVAMIGVLTQMGGHEPVPLSGWMGSRYVPLAVWSIVGIVLWRMFGLGMNRAINADANGSSG